MQKMSPGEMEEFLRRPLVVSFTIIRPDGSPHTSPIWYEYDRGKFYCFASSETVKARSVGNDSRVALCIATNDEPYRYVLAEGRCDVVAEGVAERAVSISARYRGVDRGTQFAQEVLAAGNIVLLVVTPTRLRSLTDA